MKTKPEVFPKQVEVGPDGFGNWVRLPGRHPKHPDHWSRIFDGEDFVEGDAAINLIETVRPIVLTDLDHERIRRFQQAERTPAPVIQTPKPGFRPGDERPDAARVVEALEFCKDFDNYDSWLSMGMALNNWDPSDVGLGLWTAWSRQSSKYVDGACTAKWGSFSPGGPLTIRTLFKLAIDGGWDPSRAGRGQPSHPGGPLPGGNGTYAPAASVGITDDKPFDPDSIKWNGGPRPVRTELLAVPTMPDDLIPEPLRPWLFDIAERVSCPVDFAVVPALVALGVVLGRKIGMRPKEHDVWTVIPNPWGALIGRPGVLKTPPLKEALSPLRRLELDAKVVFEREQAQYENQLLLKDIEQKVAKAEIQEAIRSKKSKSHIEKLASELADIITPDAPKQRRYTTSDITMEALGVLIRDHGHIAILRDELMGWFKNLERSEQGTAKALYLELYDGVGELFNFDRIGRGNIALTGGTGQILGGIEPGPWQSFLRAIRLDCAADDGLISRLSLLVWPDVTEWRNVDRWPDTTAKNAAFEIYKKLANLAPDAVGAKQDEYGSKMPFLHFDNKAQELFNLWRNNLETRLRTNEESPQLESHLAKYRKLMPQMAFMSHLVQVVMDGQSGPVTFKHAERGLRWCEYMEHHARRAYAGGGDQDIEPPQALAAKIKAGMVPSPFTHRDVYRHCWTNLDTPQLAGGAVAFLVDRGWLFIAENIQTGGAPWADIYIHPSLPRRVPENENALRGS